MVSLLAKFLVTVGSVATLGFGVWHFSVPKVWGWFAYLDPRATELVVAVRAINAFFSLALVLFGLMNLTIFLSGRANRFSIIVILAATCILWLMRVLFQIIYPQGSINPALQYGMLAGFVIIFLCFVVPFITILLDKSIG